MKAALLFFLFVGIIVLIIAGVKYNFIEPWVAEIMCLGVFVFAQWVVRKALEREEA